MTKRLNTIPLRAPGRLGVNTDQAASVENHEWALVLLNSVINNADRVAARNGWAKLTFTGDNGEPTESLWEYVKDSSSTYTISVADTAIFSGIDTLTEVTNTVTGVSNDWQFVNFNGKSIGVAQGQNPISWDGTGSGYADITAASGTTPKGNAACATHGRLFVFDTDMGSIKASKLLDETHWTTNAVTVDLANVWPVGLDVGVAMAEWQNNLVVFGERSILIYTGLDDIASNLMLAGSIADMITGSGLVHRDAVVSTGTDLIYLSRSGLRTIQRGIEFESLPLSSIAPQIQRRLSEDIETALNSNQSIKMVYHQPINAILCKIGGKYWYFDIRDINLIRASEWTGIPWLGALSSGSKLYLAINEGVSQYTGYQDDGQSYQWRYKSAWIPIYESAQGRRFIPKRALVYLTSGLAYTVTLSWAWDYQTGVGDAEDRVLDVPAASLWNDALWNDGLWGTSDTLLVQPYNMSGAGALLQIGIGLVVDGAGFSLQQIDLLGKYGRLQR